MTIHHVKDPAPANNGWKTCERGHSYRAPGPCPKCNPPEPGRPPA